MINDTDTSWNVHGGKSANWKNRTCQRCGRKPGESVLNIEAVIHHNAATLECVDRISCKKHAKRKTR